jgi:hypothetical protein
MTDPSGDLDSRKDYAIRVPGYPCNILHEIDGTDACQWSTIHQQKTATTVRLCPYWGRRRQFNR